jgi:acyl-[acyl-carrier-protein]-phospholipid O-acyltransferase/long-chain-fatty-acid--[acyl-carrier-protein] ligase
MLHDCCSPPIGADLLLGTLRLLRCVLFRVTVHGNVGEFDNERTLIVANHESFLDGLLLGIFLPVEATFVVHTQIANNPFFAWMLRFMPHLVVDSTSPLAIKVICKLVETGQPVIIFPEGRLTVTGSLMKVYDGAAFIAAKMGAVVVPIRIDGAGRSFFGRLAGVYPLKVFPKITITIMERRRIAMPPLPSAKERRRRSGELMRRILLEMLVATRPERTLFEAFLEAKSTFGSRYKLVEDIRLQEESYGSLLRMSLGLGRLLSGLTQPGEIVGVLMPNAAATLGLLLGLSSPSACRHFSTTPRAEGLKAPAPPPRFESWSPRGPSSSGLVLARCCRLGTRRNHLSRRSPFTPDLARQDMDPLMPAISANGHRASSSKRRRRSTVHLRIRGQAQGRGALAHVAALEYRPDSEHRGFHPPRQIHGRTAVVSFIRPGLRAAMPLVSGCKVFLYESVALSNHSGAGVRRNCTVLFGTSTFLGDTASTHPYDFRPALRGGEARKAVRGRSAAVAR